MSDEEDDLLRDLERRALFELPADEDEEDEAPDLVRGLTGEEAEREPDLTLGGYIARHDRPPAFEGADAQPYTIGIEVEDTGDEGDGRFVAFLIFIRWAATGAGIMDHLESGDVAHGATEEAAHGEALELSLYEVKAELDAAIARRADEE